MSDDDDSRSGKESPRGGGIRGTKMKACISNPELRDATKMAFSGSTVFGNVIDRVIIDFDSAQINVLGRITAKTFGKVVEIPFCTEGKIDNNPLFGDSCMSVYMDSLEAARSLVSALKIEMFGVKVE